MNRILTVMAMTMCICGVAAAQSGTTAKGQMDKGMAKDGAMTVTGCVAAGKDSGHYMLTNAMMAGMMEKDKMGASDHMMSYELMGGDVKAHMGHKVEIMGTMSKADRDMMGKMQKGTPEKDKMAGMPAKDMKAMKLNVTSVKMLSPTCP